MFFDTPPPNEIQFYKPLTPWIFNNDVICIQNEYPRQNVSARRSYSKCNKRTYTPSGRHEFYYLHVRLKLILGGHQNLIIKVERTNQRPNQSQLHELVVIWNWAHVWNGFAWGERPIRLMFVDAMLSMDVFWLAFFVRRKLIKHLFK